MRSSLLWFVYHTVFIAIASGHINNMEIDAVDIPDDDTPIGEASDATITLSSQGEPSVRTMIVDGAHDMSKLFFDAYYKSEITSYLREGGRILVRGSVLGCAAHTRRLCATLCYFGKANPEQVIVYDLHRENHSCALVPLVDLMGGAMELPRGTHVQFNHGAKFKRSAQRDAAMIAASTEIALVRLWSYGTAHSDAAAIYMATWSRARACETTAKYSIEAESVDVYILVEQQRAVALRAITKDFYIGKLGSLIAQNGIFFMDMVAEPDKYGLLHDMGSKYRDPPMPPRDV